MRLYYLLSLVFFVLVLISITLGARGRGRGRGARRQFARVRLVPFRNPASAKYYDNPNGARISQASHFESDYILGRKITFFCEALGQPRPHITWFKDGVELYFHDFFQVHEWEAGKDTIKSKMEIDPATQMDAGFYECQADNKYAIDRKGFRTDFL